MTGLNRELLTTPQELAAALRSAEPPLLLDTRPAHEFAAGHLPGAVHVDLWGLSLRDTDEAPLRAFLDMIAHVLALRGVNERRDVVVYEDVSGMRAARVFWFLEYFGHPRVRLLDGGIRAWREAGLPVTTAAEAPAETQWEGGREALRIASWQDVRSRLHRNDVVILDVRSDAEYFGEAVRAARGGAIPGAVHVEWTRAVGEDGRFRSPEELRALYESAGVTRDKEVLTYCQGGYRAAHTYLALRLLGYPRVRNYVGSWREWGDRTDLPVERPARTSNP
jgi:thiosulfate/3-mercaptopyruvate sulfurtransferase